MAQVLETPIEYLKGVGPQRAELMRKELGVGTFGDLLLHYPFRYVDRTRFNTVADIAEEGTAVQLRGVLKEVRMIGEKQARRLTAKLTDATGTIELVWFRGLRWLQPILKDGGEYIVYGKPTLFRERYNLAHPEIESAITWDQGAATPLQPVYSTTEKASVKGLNSRGIGKLVHALLPQVQGALPETLSAELVQQLGGISREEAVMEAHFPQDQKRLDLAVKRLKFEELFYIQLQLLKQKLLMQHDVKGNVFAHVGAHFNSFYTDHLPFELTGAQKRVVKEIRKDMGTGHQMNRLLQGDVGSGKTLVALLSMLIALDNGFQPHLLMMSRHADPAHAGHDLLRRPGGEHHRRAAAGPHARGDQAVRRGQARRGDRAHPRRGGAGQAGVLGVPAGGRKRGAGAARRHRHAPAAHARRCRAAWWACCTAAWPAARRPP
jgi:ATP-dependent DNA helicase RecG